MDEQLVSPDLLSDLPLGIIHIILSFVPIRDAIGTSLLSRQWRYVWASLPYLAFDEECVNPPMESGSDKNRLIHFISQVLVLHEGPIHKFELRLPFMIDAQCVNQWVLFLSTYDVRILVLEFDNDYSEFEIHSSLYSCQNLTHLKLNVKTIPPPPPSFKGFLCLRSFDINTTELDSSNIESIVARSPLLEQFTLDGCENLKITVCAPNLKYFHLKSRASHLSLCTPLLEELIVDFVLMKHFNIGAESFQGSLLFRHLRTIKLSGMFFDVEEVRMAVFRLITGPPHLQKLEISSWFAPLIRDASFWDTEQVPNLTYDSLKVIKITGFNDEINEMELIKYFLARSPVLERVIYKPFFPVSEQVLLSLTAKLLICSRASANAEIVIDKSQEGQTSQLDWLLDVLALSKVAGVGEIYIQAFLAELNAAIAKLESTVTDT